ncbi:MAG: hypothetical protein LBS14_01875 [Holosporaceae bacterium]|jgi:molecular chaperone HscB|nr:hypothetical protein [Holosporaceae bacterium]
MKQSDGRLLNCFEIFGLPIEYKIDPKILLHEYLNRQSRSHPDIGEKTETEEAPGMSAVESSLLNIAYGILVNPIKRATHFLELHGRHSDDLAPEFAMEAFSLRERYEFLSSDEEKKRFQMELSTSVTRQIMQLEAVASDLDVFQKKYSLLRFTASFLEKEFGLKVD